MRPSMQLLALLVASYAGSPSFGEPGPSGSSDAPIRRPHGALFISPMGEPFRDTSLGLDLPGKWFADADRDQDGTLTVAEMQADADRFFTTLDVKRDGEIDPDDMTRYEEEIAPEIRVSGQMPGASRGPQGRSGRGGGGHSRGGGGGGGGGQRGGGRHGGSPGSDEMSSSSREGRSMGAMRRGASRFSYLDIPQPVASTDANLNRGVSRDEFANAAAQRFVLLDSNHDGRLVPDELPRIEIRRGRRPPSTD